MIGTILNVSGILLGGIVGLIRRKPLSPQREAFCKVALGAFTVFYGLRLTWLSLNGSWFQILKQLLIAVLSLIVGRLIGRLLRLQEISNSIGRNARARITNVNPNDPRRMSAGFKACAALYCASPLGILGAVQDGISDYFYPLAIKGVIDGLATMGFVMMFGWGVILAALPVLAFQGSIWLLCAHVIRPFLQAHAQIPLVDSINAVGGLLIFCLALIILGIKKLEVADYLPSLLVAPLVTLLWR